MIWIRENATSFAAPCEACQSERRFPPAIVRGTLRSEADVGFTTCWRGHRVRVRRVSYARVEAARR
ncbi:MAG: hypothetical protein C4305_07470 [Thermoleophilia bacterium]